MAKSNKSLPPRPKRRWLKLVFIVCGAVIVIAGTVVFLIFHARVQQSAQIDPAAIQRLDAKLQQARTDKAAGKLRIVSLDETDVNALIASRLQAGTKPTQISPNKTEVKNFHVNLRDDVLHVYLAWVMNSQEMSFDIEGKVHTTEGYIKFEPVDGRLGELPLPRAMLSAALQQFTSSPEARQKFRLPADLSDLRVENSRMIITFR